MLFEISKWENCKCGEKNTDSNCYEGFMVSYSSSISKPFHRIQHICLWGKAGL